MDNDTTVTPTQDTTAESNAENVQSFTVDEKFKSYWKSQGLTDDDFKDATTFNQATIDRYAKALEKRQANPTPSVETVPAPKPLPQPSPEASTDRNLQLESVAYGTYFASDFPDIDPTYIRSGQYLKDMADAGFSPFTPDGRHINLQATSAYLKMKNEASSATKQLKELQNSQVNSQPSVTPSTNFAPVDNGMVKEMTSTAAHAILAFNLDPANQGKQHPQTAEAVAFLANH